MRGRQVKLTSRIQRLKIIDNYSARRCEPRVRSIYMYANSPAQFTASLSRSRRTIAVTSVSFHPSPVQFASIRPTYEGRTINGVNLQDLYLKKKNNLTWSVRKNRRTLHVEQDTAKLRPRQDRFSPRTFRKSGRSKKISISLSAWLPDCIVWPTSGDIWSSHETHVYRGLRTSKLIRIVSGL